MLSDNDFVSHEYEHERRIDEVNTEGPRKNADLEEPLLAFAPSASSFGGNTNNQHNITAHFTTTELKKRLCVACFTLLAVSLGIVSFSIYSLHAVRSYAHSTWPIIADSSKLAYAEENDDITNVNDNRSLIEHCEERYLKQPLNHFGGIAYPAHAATTVGDDKNSDSGYYQQRYFICDKWWQKPMGHTSHGLPKIDENDLDKRPKQSIKTDSTKCGPIFFYVGNEANVELYLNHTGFMWERGPEVGALLVFAEHRYFGKSLPFRNQTKNNMQYLSSEQALADYATLITQLKKEHNCPESTKVIGFGGSYGGMLASWFRMKYPHIIDGALAASAPILAFEGQTPPIDPSAYAAIITYDASAEAGSSEQCMDNVRSSWDILFEIGKTKEGRDQLRDIFRLCHPLNTTSDVQNLAQWIQDGFGNMAMGNYPYPSSYLTMGVTNLPAYPVRVACSYMGRKDYQSFELLGALRDAAGVYYNSSQSLSCYDLSPANDEFAKDLDNWDYLYCTEMCMPFSTNGVSDMFWKADHNWTSVSMDCENEWGTGVRPRLDWAHTVYGGRKALKTASNIIFSNGKFDPWMSYGVAEDDIKLKDFDKREIHVIDIAEGAHHLDLFFSHPLDPISVIKARNEEFEIIQRWLSADEISKDGGSSKESLI